MPRQAIDLSAHLNASVERGHPADFPVVLRPVFQGPSRDDVHLVHKRLAVVREDTGQALSVISDRYKLVTHGTILESVNQALGTIDVGPVPRGIYVDRGGARMRALYKFPELARPIEGSDTICPCLKIENTYDGTSRISIHIGAFRFVCTNLAVGGGGVFAGGFMSVHAGEIALDRVSKQLAEYLQGFDAIVETYRAWKQMPFALNDFADVRALLGQRLGTHFHHWFEQAPPSSVFEAYNRLTDHATHKMRSARTAFDMLEKVNRSFQAQFSAVAA